MLKTFASQDKHHHGHVVHLADCDVADTFPTFAEQLDANGFAFLYRRIKTGLSDGPILAAMAWGAQHGAEHKVLQAASGSAAELLYTSEGVSTLGFVCSKDVPLPSAV